MTQGYRKGWIVVFAAVAMLAVGCADNSGPATQADVNSQAKLLQKNSSVPDVPPENMVKTIGAGPRTLPKAAGTTGGGGAATAGATAGGAAPPATGGAQ